MQSIKDKYYSEISRGNILLETISHLEAEVKGKDSKVKQYEKICQELQEELERTPPLEEEKPIKLTKSIETNTEPIKQKDKQRELKKVQTLDSSPHLIFHDEELLKENDKLNEELIKKEEEYRRLLIKIDETEKENNKLIGTLDSLKRDMDYEKQTQKVLNQNIHEQRRVIENQKNTIFKLEEKCEVEQNKYDVLLDRLQAQIESRDEGVKIIRSRSLSKSEDEVESKNKSSVGDYFDTEPKSPIVHIIEEVEKDVTQLYEQIGLSRDKKVESTPFRDAEKFNSGRFDMEKKYSSNTCEAVKREQIQMKTPSIKSSRLYTPSDLKYNLKSLLQNTPLLSKGPQIIQLIIRIMKQIEHYPGPSYQDIIFDLQKKKELEQSAFNSNIMKQITQISKVRQECSEQIQQSREQNYHILRSKEDQIDQLKIQVAKQVVISEQLKEKIDYLEIEFEKARKLESQKEIVNRNYVTKKSIDENVLERLRQEKTFLLERIEKYEECLTENNLIKKKMISENEYLRNEVMFLKTEFRRTKEWVKQYEDEKKNNVGKIKEE